MIPYGRQSVDDTDIEAVVKVLQSDYLTQGPTVPAFEKAVTQQCCASHAVATNSGTSALHIACMAIGLGPGDWLWTSPNTFVASANCALYCGASVDFVDIDSKTYNLCPTALQAKLEEAEKENRLPKVVIPVHFAGQSCQMDSIYALSRKYGFKIIEDATHAIGGRYRETAIGSCLYSDIAVFSFHPVKIITSGEGGMALTNDANLAERMTRLRTHGITRDRHSMQRTSEGAWYYEQLELGFNYRMSDIGAALGASQLKRLNEFIKKRRAIAMEYNSMLANLPLVLPWQHLDSQSAWHLYVVGLDQTKTNVVRSALFDQLISVGIGVNVHYIPVHTQPYFEALGFRRGDFPKSEHYYDTSISLPIYTGLSEEDQQFVIKAIRQSLLN